MNGRSSVLAALAAVAFTVTACGENPDATDHIRDLLGGIGHSSCVFARSDKYRFW